MDDELPKGVKKTYRFRKGEGDIDDNEDDEEELLERIRRIRNKGKSNYKNYRSERMERFFDNGSTNENGFDVGIESKSRDYTKKRDFLNEYKPSMEFKQESLGEKVFDSLKPAIKLGGVALAGIGSMALFNYVNYNKEKDEGSFFDWFDPGEYKSKNLAKLTAAGTAVYYGAAYFSGPLAFAGSIGSSALGYFTK
jgi:hypothetical protein